MGSDLKTDLCWRQSHLEVPPHDFAGLLVQPLAAPVGVELSKSAGQPVMFPEQQRVQGGQRNILIGAGVTLETRQNQKVRASGVMIIAITSTLGNIE